MATLDQTLQIFRALLDAEQPVAIGEADAAIWAHLSSIPGLSAQVEALVVLRAKTVELNSASDFLPSLLDDLDLHRARLSEKSV